MTGFNIYLCSLLFLSLLLTFAFLRKSKSSLKEYIESIGYSVFLSIIPAIVLAWGLRTILPNVLEVGSSKEESDMTYKFGKDYYSDKELSLLNDYIKNISDENIYLIRVYYSKNSYDERPKSEHIAKNPTKTTNESNYYIHTILPDSIYRTRSISTRRKRVKTTTALAQEVMVISEAVFLKETERNNEY